MAIASIETRNFRNLDGSLLEIGPRLTVLVGDNGEGKTNLLEAVYYLATTRSFRKASSSEMVRHGETGFEIRGTVVGRGRNDRIEVRYGGDGITRLRHGKRAVPEEYFAALRTVAVSSGQIGIIHGGPEERRRFMDRGIVGVRPGYLRQAATYNRVRRQRNAALLAASKGRPDSGSLEAWDEQLVAAGGDIMREREEFCRRLKKKQPWSCARCTGKKGSWISRTGPGSTLRLTGGHGRSTIGSSMAGGSS